MKNYTDSDYALNKYSEGIVYRFADGIKEVTLADYLAENPDKTEADFHALKELSDSIYLNQVQDENAQTKKNTTLHEFDETYHRHALSPEELHISKINAHEKAERRKQKIELMNRALETLTEVQRRRYRLYHADSLSTWKIAELEGVNQKSVLESLQSAEKKIKKFFARSQKIPPQNG